MKTKILLSTLFAGFLLVTNLSAQQPSFEWAKRMGGTDTDFAQSITTDANGNIYVTGFFRSKIDFGPGVGTSNLISNGDSDIFILKLDAGGNLLWVKQMGGSGDDGARSVATDASGNVFTTGSFQGTVDFDPGASTVNLTAKGTDDIFIQKLDTEGNFLWIKQIGGDVRNYGYSITTDANGNEYTTGSFQSTADFDPGAGTVNLTSNGSGDIFIQKLDSNGSFLWAKQMGERDSDKGLSITTDANGNVYTTGWFQRTVDFDPGAGTVNLTSNGFDDIFIQKLDAGGNFLWVKQMGGTSLDAGVSIATDTLGNVYTSGWFQGTVDFDPGAGTTNLTSNGFEDIFIQKLDANGNLLWVKQMGGTGIDLVASIATDANGNIFTTGWFQGTIDFDPGVGTTNLTSNGSDDIFIQKLDAAGNLLWAKQLGGTEDDLATSITTDASGNVYITGGFQETVDFDPGPETTNITSIEYADAFVLKLSQPTTVGISENTFTEKIQVYPNPTTGNFAIKFETIQKDLSVRLLSISGQTIETRTFQNTGFVQLKLNQPNGFYLVELQNEKGNKTGFRLIKK